MLYNNLSKNTNIVKSIIPKFSINFVDGAIVEVINGELDKKYKVVMSFDGNINYQTLLNKGMWAKSNIKYFKNWNIKLYDNSTSEIILDYNFNPTDKKVYITFDSKSLGDTLAWIPYVEEFRKKHNCITIVSTFHNEFFKEQYNQIEFVNPGQSVNNLYAMYKIGWYYSDQVFNNQTNPRDFKQLPLQQTICDILGLDYTEIRPILKSNAIEKKKKIGLGIHSTAQSKYWNNPNGWQQVVNYLKDLDYEVMVYSREPDGYMGNYQPKGVTKFKGGDIQQVVDDLRTCELFIGLGSGLSWLAWASEIPVVIISGFSKPYSETTTDTFRVFNNDVCNGCFNTHRLNAGDWNWCPINKGTDKQFECTKEITSEMVIDKINEALKITSI